MRVGKVRKQHWVLYCVGYLCKQLEFSPTGDLWETGWDTSQSCPSSRVRKLEY